MKTCSCGAHIPTAKTPNQQQCAACLSLKVCACGVRYTHPTRDKCGKCSGWVCLQCGRCKTPEQVTCGRVTCKRVRTLKDNRSKDASPTRKSVHVLPIRKRGEMK